MPPSNENRGPQEIKMEDRSALPIPPRNVLKGLGLLLDRGEDSSGESVVVKMIVPGGTVGWVQNTRSPDKQGMSVQQGDFLTEVDNIRVASLDHVVSLIKASESRASVSLSFRRAGPSGAFRKFTEAYPRPACAWRDTPTMAAEHVMRDADTQEEQQYVMLGGDCASNANLIVSNAIKSFQNVEIALRRCDAVGASEWLDRARRCWKASGRCKSEIAQRMEGLKAEIGKLDQGSSGGSSFDYLKQVHGAQPVTVGGSVGLVRDAATHRRGEGRKYAPLASHKQKAWLSSQLESPRCRQSESPLPEMLARLGLNVRGDSEAWQIVPSQESPLGSPTVGKVIPGPLFIPPTLDKAPLALPRGKTSSNNSLEPLIRKFEGMQAGSTTPRGRVDVLASPRGRQGSPLPMQPLHSPRGGVTLPPAEIPNSLPPTRPPSLIMDVVDALDKADSTTQTSDSPKGSQAFDRPAQATPTKGTPNKHVVPMLSIPPPAHDAAVSSRSNAGDFTDRSGKAGRGQLMIQGRRIPGLLEGLVALVGGSDVFDQRPS